MICTVPKIVSIFPFPCKIKEDSLLIFSDLNDDKVHNIQVTVLDVRFVKSMKNAHYLELCLSSHPFSSASFSNISL